MPINIPQWLRPKALEYQKKKKVKKQKDKASFMNVEILANQRLSPENVKWDSSVIFRLLAQKNVVNVLLIEL